MFPLPFEIPSELAEISLPGTGSGTKLLFMGRLEPRKGVQHLGRAFGIVSTGFNFSGILSPLLFGWVMDRNLPHWVFGLSAVFMVLTVLLAPFTERKPDARLAPAEAA